MQSAFFSVPSSILFCRFLHALCVLGALCVIPFVSSARAQENYEIQVHAYDTVEPGHTMLELHSNFTFDGSKTSQDGMYPPTTSSTKPSKSRTASRAGSRRVSIFSLPRTVARGLIGLATTLVRAFAFRPNGNGRSA